MRHNTKVKVFPIWRIFLSDRVYYFVVGSNKKLALEIMKNCSELNEINRPYKIEQLSPDDYDKILLQTDLDDDDSYTTLAEEAKYFVEHGLEKEFFIASSFDVIADWTLHD